LTSGLVALRKAMKSPEYNRASGPSGMIAYVAYTQEVNETTVCEVLTSHFGVGEVSIAFPPVSKRYRISCRFEMDKVMN
jgi:hypothetical protein